MITAHCLMVFQPLSAPTKTAWQSVLRNRSGLAGQGFRRIFGQIHQAGRQGTLTIKLWRRRRISYISCIYIYYVYRENEKDIYIYTVDTSLYDIIWYHSMSMSVYIYIVCLVQYTVLQSIAMQSNAKCKSKQFVNVMCIILYNANVMYCKVCIVSYRMVLYGTVWYGTGQNLGPIPRPQQMSSPACLHFLADATISGSTKGCIGRRCPTNINV